MRNMIYREILLTEYGLGTYYVCDNQVRYRSTGTECDQFRISAILRKPHIATYSNIFSNPTTNLCLNKVLSQYSAFTLAPNVINSGLVLVMVTKLKVIPVLLTGVLLLVVIATKQYYRTGCYGYSIDVTYCHH